MLRTSSDLRNNIENLEKNSVTSLRTLVNLGSEVYMQADVPDTRRIFVDIGLGFHVEFTWSEALNYISQREEKIARQIEEYTNLIASIKAQIKLSLTPIQTPVRRGAGKLNCILIMLNLNRTLHLRKGPTSVVVCEGIRELLQLPAEKRAPERIF
ncbi:Prefoldin chaperone subunit family protein [Prunus dulcis]|uniref:Prefoldin chaperone subunit family protein n=1 Tax=Prunus dulcis TaxID=3755 RepID=A0A4Y1QR04_PRUDU|nr:Prefoldin chaperone subunit family protein [Prunus dulcis]